MTAPFPVSPAELARAGQALAAEFPPPWQIKAGDVWSADWQSEDGRERKHVAAGSATALLAALRTSANIDPAAVRAADHPPSPR